MDFAPAEKIEILEDWHDCIAVSKPAGWLTVPGRGHKENVPVLSQKLGRQIRDGQKQTETDLYIVHRLDEGTSGVILFARTADAHRELNGLFETRAVKKTYWCLVAGTPQSQTVDLPLFKIPSKKIKSVVDDKGKPAQTVIRVRATHDGISLVEAEPLTGRSHQIRVHLAHLGFPLIGDKLYGGLNKLSGQLYGPELPYPLLHARQITFTRSDGQVCTATAPLKGEFEMIRAALGLIPS